VYQVQFAPNWFESIGFERVSEEADKVRVNESTADAQGQENKRGAE
jgi:N-acetylglutamate synthase-like GNAT family acetyltransferase